MNQVRQALEAAIKAAGSQSALARRMNEAPSAKARKVPYRQQHIFHWLSVGSVPAEHAPAIEWATDGVVTRYDLHPDVFGEPPAHAA